MHGSRAQFQNPICTATFCCSIPRAFSPLCARQLCDVVNSHLLFQIFRFDTVKLKTMLLEFLFLGINNI